MESLENTVVIHYREKCKLQAQLYIIPLNYEPNEDCAAKTGTLLFTPLVIHEICVPWLIYSAKGI